MDPKSSQPPGPRQWCVAMRRKGLHVKIAENISSRWWVGGTLRRRALQLRDPRGPSLASLPSLAMLPGLPIVDRVLQFTMRVHERT